jgi:hypothetical protein
VANRPISRVMAVFLLVAWLCPGSCLAQAAPSLEELESKLNQKRAQHEAELKKKEAAAQKARDERARAEERARAATARAEADKQLAERNELYSRLIGTWKASYLNTKSSNPDCPSYSFNIEQVLDIHSVDNAAGTARAKFTLVTRSSDSGKKWCSSSSTRSVTADVQLKIDPKYWNVWHARTTNIRCSCQHYGAFAKTLNDDEYEHCEREKERLADLKAQISSEPPYDQMVFGASKFAKSR